MKIIIVGMGRVGRMLADRIPRDGHDVTVVDRSQKTVDEVTDRYNVGGVCGSGMTRSTLLKAGADSADLVISVTGSDEINVMCCAAAKSYGTRYAVAMVHDPDFSEETDSLTRDFRIDYTVNPQLDTAAEMAMHIGLPGTVHAEGFFGSSAVLFSYTVGDASPLVGMSLRQIREYFETNLLVGTVQRKGKVLIPNGALVIERQDVLGLIVPDASMKQVLTRLELMKKPAKNVLIVGGGTVCYYLAKRLLSEHKSVTLIESDRNRCAELAKLLPDAAVCFGEGTDADVLKEEGIETADACVSLTGKDEVNLAISMFAWSCKVPSILTKLTSPSYERLLHSAHIQNTFSPAVISVDRILACVRNLAVYNEKGNDIQRLYRIADGRAEATEFIAYPTGKKLGIPLKSPEMKLKKNILLGAILRGNQAIIPDGNSVILEGDHVIVISAVKAALNTLDDIFQ